MRIVGLGVVMLLSTTDLGGGDANAAVGGVHVTGRKGVVGVDGGLALMVGGVPPSVRLPTGTVVAAPSLVGSGA